MENGMNRRIVFMGTPAFAVPTLEALASSQFRVAAVYTQPDRPSGRGRKLVASPVKEFAISRDIPVYQPESLRPQEVQDRLAALRPDVIVVAAYGLILPRTVLAIPTSGALNIHPSLLPRHRGPSPIANALLEGDDVTGVAIMLVRPRVDSGPVLSSRSLRIGPEDTTGSLTDELALIGAGLLMETLGPWLDGRVQPEPQDEALATYSRMISKGDAEIDWQLPALQIWRQVRAFHPWPGASTLWRGKRLKVLKSEPISEGPEARPGEVVQWKNQNGDMVLAVGTGKGLLGLFRVQLEGRRETDAESFALGHREFVGALLPS